MNFDFWPNNHNGLSFFFLPFMILYYNFITFTLLFPKWIFHNLLFITLFIVFPFHIFSNFFPISFSLFIQFFFFFFLQFVLFSAILKFFFNFLLLLSSNHFQVNMFHKSYFGEIEKNHIHIELNND